MPSLSLRDCFSGLNEIISLKHLSRTFRKQLVLCTAALAGMGSGASRLHGGLARNKGPHCSQTTRAKDLKSPDLGLS